LKSANPDHVKIGSVKIYTGDCLEILPTLQQGQCTAVLTDPPYGLSDGPTKYLGDDGAGGGFMGAKWDHGVPGIPFWQAVAGVCRPGAYLLAFGGTRTFHRQAVAIEDAGWMIRDCLAWVYGSGFPKSLNLSAAIDKAAGAERVVVGTKAGLPGYSLAASKGHAVYHDGIGGGGDPVKECQITAPATPAAHTWQGYGTALKPALEPITLAMLPRDGSFVDKVHQHGCGGLAIDACRIETSQSLNGGRYSKHGPGECDGSTYASGLNIRTPDGYIQPAGRWPANLLISDCPEVVDLFPSTGPARAGARGAGLRDNGTYGKSDQAYNNTSSITDSGGSAARFYYCAKASRAERELGCESLPAHTRAQITGRKEGSAGQAHARASMTAKGHIRNTHPTVKPLMLMRYLLRLVTQPEVNLVLDPFAGSGTTGMACALAGIPCVLIEQDPHHVEIIKSRVQWAADLRQRLGRAPDLDLSPYMKPATRSDDGGGQGSLF
jgi:DNA modification methylase